MESGKIFTTQAGIAVAPASESEAMPRHRLRFRRRCDRDSGLGGEDLPTLHSDSDGTLSEEDCPSDSAESDDKIVE